MFGILEKLKNIEESLERIEKENDQLRQILRKLYERELARNENSSDAKRYKPNKTGYRRDKDSYKGHGQ